MEVKPYEGRVAFTAVSFESRTTIQLPYHYAEVIRELYRCNAKVAAIKFLRAATDCSLSDAKNCCDEIGRNSQPRYE